MLPFIEVSHLPSSSSFYSAVLQPLGLRCAPAELKDDSPLLQTSVTYGFDGSQPILEVRQSANPLKPPKLSSLVLSASTLSAVSRFHATWLQTDPPSWSLFRDDRGLEKVYGDRDRAVLGPQRSIQGGVTVSRSVIYDHDGNRIEAVCPDSPATQSSPHSRAKEPPLVLAWNHDFQLQSRGRRSGVVQSISMAPATREFPYTQGQQQQARSNHSNPSTRPEDVRPSQVQQGSDSSQLPSGDGGLNTTTVWGALLGAAAGAALTYGFVSNTRDSSPSYERELERPHGFQRRATFPEKPVTGHRYPERYESSKVGVDQYDISRKVPYSNLQHLPTRGGYGYDDKDVEYGLDPPMAQPPRSRSQSRAPSVHTITRSRASSRQRPVDDMSETRSRRASRVGSEHSVTSRARSETPRDRFPMDLVDNWEQRSQAPSRGSKAPLSAVSRPPLSKSHRSHAMTDHETYVSARSRRTATTMREQEKDRRQPRQEPDSRSRTSRRGASVTREALRDPPADTSSRVSARRVPLPHSTVGSSRAGWDPWDVPLPMSGVGSSHAAWDDDMASLAPSDSISCAGSKSSRRSRKHRR